jgi:DNA-binding transcriptional regulator YiaG
MSAEEYREPRLSPESVKRARKKLNLTLWEFATMLGYEGENRRSMGFDLESGRRPVREPQRRLIEAYLAGYRPPDWGNEGE